MSDPDTAGTFVTSLAHVCLKTTSLQRSKEFYCDTLGLAIAFRFTRKGREVGFYLRASASTFIEVFKVDETESIRREHSLNHLCLETSALRETRQRLVDCGYSPEEIILGADNTLQFWVASPDGLRIEFQEYTDRSAQLIGEDVELES